MVTVVMVGLRRDYWWIGLVVMAALVLLEWLEFFTRMLIWRIDGIKNYKAALGTRDSEKIECARKSLEEDSWKDVVIEPLKRAGMVALVGLIAIPLFVIGRLMDAINAGRRFVKKA